VSDKAKADARNWMTRFAEDIPMSYEDAIIEGYNGFSVDGESNRYNMYWKVWEVITEEEADMYRSSWDPYQGCAC
jgi:hypothetical protein